MSFGGGGGFGGFGSNNNQSTGFGFGANNNNTTGGFGSNTGNAFGSNNNSGGNMFGGNTTSTFGGGGGFGATNNNTTTSAFGSKPFGASTTGGGLFGGGGATGGTTFGGFGASNTNNASSGFGGASATTGTSLFGGAKPAFGAGSTTNTGGGMFGGGGATGGFGSNNTGGGFGGGATGGGFGAGAANTTNNGTASTPFQAHTEKDGTSATQHYQTITFQQPYMNFSLEELRLADYNQGRRYGNANGQGGAFGQNSTFGGFGANNNNTTTTPAFGANNTNTGGGLFGGASTTNTTGGFGQTAGGFGANNNTNTGGGLFGAKPATGGGLFGGSNTASTGTTGGGLFGGASNTNTTGGFGSGGGFGAANNTSNTGGGGLFGSNNAAKPATGFGAANTTTGFGASTNTGFGQQSNTTGGGLFGQNNQASATPAFGGAAATTNSGGGLFGGGGGGAFGQNNNTQAPASGGLFGGGGGFGQNNNQAKPATGGLFGGGAAATNTGGGLFGGANTTTPAPATGGLFGSSTANNNTGGGLFGGAQKPAATGGLFGGAGTTNTGAATGGGLFGSLGGQNNQANAGSSLFGGQNNQQKPGGLFGSSTTNNNTGGGMFGGSLGQNNQQQGNLGGSLFGASQNNQQQNQQQNGNSLFGASGSSLLNTSLQTNPYGNDALFAGLATPTQSPGPIATPLSSSQKNKKSAILPQHKLNPASSTRLLTPQTKRTGGYGFSYSTYGSPASSQATPNLGGSLFAGGSLSRSLGSRSTSMSNLRNSFTPETSILAPGAFSATGRSFGNGSLKKLNVNRSINTRIPLFDEPAAKRVSFAGGDGDTLNGSANGETAMVVRRDDGDASPRSVNGDASPEPSRPAMQQVNGNEVARVPENDSALTPKSSSAINAQPGEDPEPGEYWSQPSVQQLKKMNKQELKIVRNFTVGRHNIGQIEFHQGAPVDLSETNIDLLFGDIVQLNHRNATVYGENCTCLPKPPMGTALNHPSRVTLYNSWPRNKAGRKDAKHLERLKRVAGTTFESYDAATGGWVFTVPHFSSYGLDYENDYSDDENEESSELSPVPDTPAQTLLNTSQMTSTPQQDSLISPDGSSPDDTFDFKRGMRQRASVPGGFGDEAAYEEYEDDEEDSRDESFLGERSVGSFDGQSEADHYESESELDQDQSMADSVSGPIHTTEPAAAMESDPFRSTLKAPKSILKASQIFKPGFGTPSKGPAVFDDDWADQLQRTISPRKQDRTALRESQGHGLRDQNGSPTFAAQSINARPFATHMDLMNSLFGETEDHRESFSKRQGQGIELPYPKRPKSSHDLDEMTADDREFHNSSKPHFSETGVLIYGNKGTQNLENGAFSTAHQPLADASKDIRFLKMPTFDDAVPETLGVQKQQTKISTAQGVPFATIITDPAPIEFSSLAKAVAVDTVAGSHEQHAWQLLSLLFDGADRIKKPADVDSEHIQRYRKERLSEFWKNLVYHDAQKHAQKAATAEERAIAQLSCNNVAEACHALLEGLDLRLATMIAQIGGDPNMRQTMSTQIEEWRRLDMLAEMEDAHRALYELLSGNCAQADGKLGNGRENKAATFNISSRFALDWRRAFGLRLWYGTLVDEPIELAVAQFADAVRDGLEVVKPVPWFIRDNADMGWTDPDAANREDLLWGILKLYASSKLDIPANVEDVLAPENVSGHPLNARLSFQLFQLFYSRHRDEVEEPERKVGMPTMRDDSEGDFRRSFMSSTATVTNKDTQGADPLVELGDNITLSYAASLHTQAHWATAVWVYTHLSSAAMREHYIRSLINQFAKSLNLTESDPTYAYLTDELHIPATWLHAAAALQAKTEGDAVREATHLIKAEELEEAHEVLCRKVGPDAIISRDYEPLRELMAGFLPEDSDGPANDGASLASSRRSAFGRASERVAGWAQGGQIYLDYIELLDHTGRRSTYRIDEELEQEIQHLLAKLQQALEIAARDRLESCGLEERVALMEIAGTVANLVAKNKQIANRSQILKLPLTEDLWLKHSCDLSANYYRTLMANTR